MRAVLRCAFLASLLALFLSLGSVAHAQTRVSMSASASRVAVGEPFAVEIRIESNGDEPDDVQLPDFDDFEVLGRSTSRPFSFSFAFGSGGQRARVRSETVYTFTLRATDAGAKPIQAAIVKVGGRKIASQALNIMVLQPTQAMPGAAATAPSQQGAGDAPSQAPPTGPLDGAQLDQTMFLRTVIDKKQVYVGEQVTVTLYLYLRGQLGDSPSITREPTLEGFWVHDLLPIQRSLTATRQEVNGRSYSAYVLRRFAAFPLRPGTLKVGAPQVEVGTGGSIFDLLNGPSRPLRRDGVEVALEVLALPHQPTANAPTHTGSLTLEASLDSTQVKVGEAATLRLVARGSGNLRGLTLAGPTLDGVDVLAPEIDDQVTSDRDGVGGERQFRWLMLPRKPGSYSVPSFAIDVFDPESRTYRTVRSPALNLTVVGTAAVEAKRDEPATNDALSPRFGPVRRESGLLRREPELRERGFFWPLVLAAPTLLLVLLGVRVVQRERARQRSVGLDGQALREVDDKLAQANEASARGDASAALSMLASALKRSLEATLREPVGGLTMTALGAHLTRRGLPDPIVQRVVAQLGAIERARFDPVAHGAVELGRAVEGVRALTRDLAQVPASSLTPLPTRTSERPRDSLAPEYTRKSRMPSAADLTRGNRPLSSADLTRGNRPVSSADLTRGNRPVSSADLTRGNRPLSSADLTRKNKPIDPGGSDDFPRKKGLS